MAAVRQGSTAALSGARLPYGEMGRNLERHFPDKKEGGEMIERILQSWCRRFHKRITTPFRGQYECLSCLRTYPAGYR
jgi:hypothetical protein